jgi:hypothetical protein
MVIQFNAINEALASLSNACCAIVLAAYTTVRITHNIALVDLLQLSKLQQCIAGGT